MSLTNVSVINAKPKGIPYKLSDEKGLYLHVMPKGGKYWRMAYRWRGKQKTLALGVYPEISLKDARERRDEARKMLAGDNDPSQKKKEEKQERRTQSLSSFEAIAREWHDMKRSMLVPKYAHDVLHRLEVNVFPFFRGRLLQEIKPSDLLEVIKRIEARGALDISHRVLESCNQIFRYAILTGRCEYNPATDLRGALKVAKITHHSHLRTSELPEFLKKLKAYDGHPRTRLALQLLLLTFVRTTELRGAEWKEIDLDVSLWRIPAERMKMKLDHLVPLSKQALDILGELQKFSHGQSFIFPNDRKSYKYMSENTMLYALYRMGYHSRATGHGFRATASTILNENGFRSDVVERQLAHIERNKVRGAYNHAEYLSERKTMMQWWADYLDKISVQGEVIQGHFAKVA